jgi:hypothetical protein
MSSAHIVTAWWALTGALFCVERAVFEALAPVLLRGRTSPTGNPRPRRQ